MLKASRIPSVTKTIKSDEGHGGRVITLPVGLLTATVHPQSPGSPDPMVLGNPRSLLYPLL